MKFRMVFDTEKVFQAKVIPVFDAYFKGELKASDATIRLGWSRDQFDRALSGIFSLAKQGFEGFSLKADK
jgi:hypothetical protein